MAARKTAARQPERARERARLSQRPRSAIALHLLKFFPLTRLLEIERGGDYAKVGGFF